MECIKYRNDKCMITERDCDYLGKEDGCYFSSRNIDFLDSLEDLALVSEEDDGRI